MTDMSFRFKGTIEPDSLSARQLISVLHTLDDLVGRASKSLYGSSNEIDYRISNVKPGSIGIEGAISLIASLQPAFAQLPQLTFQIDSVAKLIKSWLDILKFLNGSTPKAVVNIENGNSVQITNNSGEVTTVNGNVYHTLVINQVPKRARKLRIPIEAGAKSFEITENGRPIAEYTSSDISAINNISLDEPINSEINAILEIKSPVLNGNGAWRFKYGTSTLVAKISDADFLKRVDERREHFAHGDKFHVRLKTSQKREGTKLKTTHEVVRILNRV